jgi:hypothetical protein
VHDPPPRDTQRRLLLRQEVGRFRQRESRRVFDTSVHVGVLAGPRNGWRTAWVVRAGTPDVHDADLEWLSAVHVGFGVHGRPLEGCFVLTRAGWRDLHSGEVRVWARLRL